MQTTPVHTAGGVGSEPCSGGPVRADEVVARLQALPPATGADAPTGADLDRLCGAILDAFDEAARSSELARKLEQAETRVRIDLVDAPHPRSIGLCFEPGSVAGFDGAPADPEVTIYIRCQDFADFWAGEMHPATMIAEGVVGYEGPVRKVLRMVPIVRSLLPQVAANLYPEGGVQDR
jgi:hypothetical protein